MAGHKSKILLAVDFSEDSEAAADVALQLARRLDAAVDALHVTRPGLEDEAMRRLRHHLSRFHGAPLRHVVEAGSPSERIVRYARDHSVDLVVLGRHGNTGFTRALLGSVAERVSRTAPCPVMMVPRAAGPDRTGVEAATHLAAPATGGENRACLVCQAPCDELICEACRSRIRAEAAERRQEEFSPLPL
jgi:nucleotide-binding universal stress UspA family protein